MNKFAALVVLPATLLVAACNNGPGAPAGPPPLAGASMGGAFSLTDQDGKTVTDAAFAGQYRMVYFGYTFCPDVCPVDVQRLMQGFALLEKQEAALAARIQPIFITVDPARDTPPRLKEFVGNFHPRLIGLTGTPEQIADVAKRYAVVYQKGKGTSPDAYLVDHSRTTVLYGPKGEPIALIPQDGAPEAIAAELKRWVK